MSERSKHARKDLRHTEAVMLRLHPDLKSYVEEQAAGHYCSQAEFIRQLIIDHMHNGGAT